MSIQSGDIKIFASQVMDDVPEGGGGPTATVIRDGVSNEVFQDISEVARTGGRTYLRKLFLGVDTPDTERYLDANIILSELPADPRVSVTLYATRQTFDRRDEARSRAEGYFGSGSEWHGYLLENHLRDQRIIQLFQIPGSDPPTVGRTLRLVWHEGLADQREQYVRASRITAQTRTFMDSNGKPYQALVIGCELMDKLRFDFPGSPPSNLFSRLRNGNDSVVRDTIEANALTYYGASRLTHAAAMQQLTVQVESVFSQIVPSAQTEIPLLQFSAANQAYSPVQSDNGTVSYTTGVTFNAATVLALGNPVYPGTLQITTGGGLLTDLGGQLMADNTAVGVVDYARGEVRFAATAPGYTGAKTATFRPAGAPLQLADSAGSAVTQESRAYNWQITLSTPPAPGTAFAAYLSGGKWYELRDNGAGVLKGADASFGTGTVSYSTNTLTLSCGALPDAGSTVIWGWGARVNYMNRAGAAAAPPGVYLKLVRAGIAPGSLSITWNDGSLRTVTDNTHGQLTGAGVTNTRVNYTTGEVWFTPALLPAVSTQYQCSYGFGAPEAETLSAVVRSPSGSVALALARSNIRPATFEMSWNLAVQADSFWGSTPVMTGLNKTVRDNGQGTLVDAAGQSSGSIDYAAGTITFTPDIEVSVPSPDYGWKVIGTVHRISGGAENDWRFALRGFNYVSATAVMPSDASNQIKVTYRSGDVPNTGEETITAQGIALDLTQYFSEAVVPGSVNFRLGGKTWFDRLGSLYYDLDITTGSAIVAGTINYQSGQVLLTAWPAGAAHGYALRSLLTSIDGRPVDEVTFRTSVSPIKPGSFQLQATRVSGGQINLTAGLNGDIAGTNVAGHLDYETGVARCRFGAWVTAAGNESQPWYAAEVIRADGKIWHPAPVFADTIRYNAVGYTWLPLDADVIGMDPVRLPQDGRVSIFRQGGYVVFGHTASIGPATLANGQVINCARTRLARVALFGADGVAIDSGYSADLDAGRITVNDTSAWAQPVTVKHRIEEMKYLSDVQINGALAFTTPLTREFPPGSIVSSALIAGDQRARVSLLFCQSNWLGNTWQDSLNGSASTAKYDDRARPIVVTNRGAETERWIIVINGNGSSYNVIGEHVGQIVSNWPLAQDCAPVNPAAGGAPYWTLRAAGWGQGWVPGNVVRFNTVGTRFPFWTLLTVQPGPETVIDDAFGLLGRGGVDRPAGSTTGANTGTATGTTTT